MKGKEVMKKTISTTLKAGVAALALVAASGCASQKSLDEVKATADKAVQDAAAAKAAADSAASAAQSARSAADSAQSAANQALQAAQASQACCDATNEKIERMFKKSVSK
jgi:Alanine-zipper, major outer membrane lipoprotein